MTTVIRDTHGSKGVPRPWTAVSGGPVSRVLHSLAPHARRHRGTFLKGACAGLVLVAARVSLPWPLRAVVDLWTPGAGSGSLAFDQSTGPLDPVLMMGLAFLGLVALMGLADHLERLWFARFSIATMRDLRGQAIGVVERGRYKKKELGDLIARLIGDTARAKTGLRGFLVHVLTNGALFLGVVLVLLALNPALGLIFAVAGAATALLTVWGARRMLLASLKQRSKEGRLAKRIHSLFRRSRKESALRTVNRSSGWHEAAQARLQGMITWAAHCIFGLAVALALWASAASIESGRTDSGDLVVLMLYALMLRGPFVQLSRQGVRTGRIFGATYRVVQILERGSTPDPDPDRQSARSPANQNETGSSTCHKRVL